MARDSDDRTLPGPPLAPEEPLPDRYYSTRLRQLAHLDLCEEEARELWLCVGEHRRGIEERLGRDVGARVALLDLLVNFRARIEEPQIIARSALEEIRGLASVDGLTGLFNRRHFEDAVTHHVERVRRSGGSAALILLDLDRFKEINDRYGHPAGDEVLRRVGAVIRECIRAPDVACRYGGDEFAIILPDASLRDAVAVRNRIHRAVIATAPDGIAGGHGPPLRITGGVAGLGPQDPSAADWIARADRALYRAKQRRVPAGVRAAPSRTLRIGRGDSDG